MLGVDIINLDRIKESYSSLADRLLSKREYLQYQKLDNIKQKIEYVGGRFASKEAFIKAKNQKNIPYKDIEILSDENGKPHLYYLEKEVGEVSISHDGYLVSVVLLK